MHDNFNVKTNEGTVKYRTSKTTLNGAVILREKKVNIK